MAKTPDKTQIDVSLDEAIEEAYAASRTKRERRLAREKWQEKRPGCLSGAEILGMWEQHHGKLSPKLRREFSEHPALNRLVWTPTAIVTAAIGTSPKLRDILREAEAILVRVKQEKDAKQALVVKTSEAMKASVRPDLSGLELGPIARAYIFKEIPARKQAIPKSRVRVSRIEDPDF